jgi:hypothetical protein
MAHPHNPGYSDHRETFVDVCSPGGYALPIDYAVPGEHIEGIDAYAFDIRCKPPSSSENTSSGTAQGSSPQRLIETVLKELEGEQPVYVIDVGGGQVSCTIYLMSDGQIHHVKGGFSYACRLKSAEATVN